MNRKQPNSCNPDVMRLLFMMNGEIAELVPAKHDLAEDQNAARIF